MQQQLLLFKSSSSKLYHAACSDAIKIAKAIFTFTFLVLAISACSQHKNERTILGKEYAEKQLKLALSNNTQHNVIDGKTLILKDSTTAISVAALILFGTYGKENITRQRPYETYFIGNYWIISGTVSKSTRGGIFFIIMNASDGRVLSITHGK